jgi:predicted RNA binding protein YcfA (HicA-like mRNA interferase family)
LTLEEADRFLKKYGYIKARQNGSHCIYKHDGAPMINIQGNIVPEYQVQQMIDAVDSII